MRTRSRPMRGGQSTPRSTADRPPVTDLVALPDHKIVRVLEKNEELIARLEKLDRAPTEFFRVGYRRRG